jgi:hypothetical protein
MTQTALVPPALHSYEDVKEFANGLLRITDQLHRALRRLTSMSNDYSGTAYALLTEEYGLRARTNILLHDSARHRLEGLSFSQQDLLRTLEQVGADIEIANSLEMLSSTVADLAMFATSISPGKERVVNFLAGELGMMKQ